MLKNDMYAPLKIFKRNRKKYIFDPIRKKLILQTPEEVVRQKFVQYLIMEKGVPKDMIEVEVPMSYFVPKAKGRADIIVYTIENNSRVPILIIECKSKTTPLIDDVFDQVYDYEEVLYANTVAVTNGVELYVETWNEKSECYVLLQELPNYIDLVNTSNYKYITSVPFTYKRREFKDFYKKEDLDFYNGHFLGITDEKLYSFIINLNELFWDDTVKIPYKELYGVRYIEDIGVRYTKFGNVAGYDWTGEYRSIIVEDKKGSHQIVSFAILGGYLIVAIDNDKYSHNSLQLFIKDFVKVNGHSVEVAHNGRLILGKSGMVKFAEVLDFIERKEPNLLNDDRKIELGLLDNSRQFDWNEEDVKEFIGRLVKYALIRDEFRDYKRKSLIKRKSRSKKR
ncbi:type I restriction enzyme HsdR N-terminal domain-containing protein [Bacillus sp. HNG]|uniref:type I restriction enzyme HsdR N-terminal domain-containing protein n=1 Tax=Bacillus sp. HNG TaxID=2293325 RepID=UPI001677BA74|nr:type I restriction enzyme HsdR N-terminal domain-containing protein [Bacillus sp. HNG]